MKIVEGQIGHPPRRSSFQPLVAAREGAESPGSGRMEVVGALV